jgi:HAD superfamily hydrolase (TIGR01509 family)
MLPADLAAVVFDIGGVLINDVRSNRVFRDLDRVLGLPPRTVVAHWGRWRPRLFTGAATDEAYFDDLAALAGGRVPASAIRARVLAGWHPHEEAVRALERLARAGVPVAAATNHYRPWLAELEQRMPWLGLLDPIVCSSDVGVRKPDPRFFALLAERFPHVPARTLYLDDQRRNVEAAGRAGYRAVRVEPGTLPAPLSAV